MKIKFWGVRGSIPCPGPHTVKYGGNTPCIELSFRNTNRCFIVDAGSGIRELGHDLLARHRNHPLKSIDLFITHTHWDHIQGFPFFTPIYNPNMNIKIYGPVTYDNETLKDAIVGQLSYRYFPVRQTELASKMEYEELNEGHFDLGDGIILKTKYLNHPLLCMGYRFEYQKKSICMVFDTEPLQNLFNTDPSQPDYNEAMANEGEQVVKDGNQRIIDFYAGADILIHDAQYTQDEYEAGKKGWGHSPIEDTIDVVKRNDVKQLVLFHHDPIRTDKQLDQLCKIHCKPCRKNNTSVSFAVEGTQVVI
jgi:phosphoribosyl 1,2-cyclic phosphodiesterase